MGESVGWGVESTGVDVLELRTPRPLPHNQVPLSSPAAAGYFPTSPLPTIGIKTPLLTHNPCPRKTCPPIKTLICSTLNPAPAGLPDVERLARRLEARRLGLPELCQLYRASAVLPMIEDAVRCHQGPHAQLLVNRCVWAVKGGL